nr:UbiA prenyltransferase family protein [Candidatus Shapirobacteria bacterium]
GLGLASFISLKIFLILVLYLFMNLLYSKWLKYVPVIDVMLIAIGFVLRILSGAIATNILLSPWIILCTFFGALFLGFGKRKSEINNLKSDSEKTRSILSFYEHNFLNQLLGLAAGITITSYTLYTIDQNTINHFQTTGLIYTIPFVVFGVCRFFQIIYTQSAGENPTKVFLTDRPILLNTLLWILAFGLIILF